MMVLGLVIQQPDTVAGVALRLAEQFPAAHFPSNSAHTNLPSMKEKGYVRLIEEGRTASLNRYEATRKGRERFRRWIRSVGLPPTMRNALQGKLEFVELEDLPALLQAVRVEEAAYTAASHAARARVLEEQAARRLARGRPGNPQVKLRSIQSQYEADLWVMMSQGIGRLCEDLEGLVDEVSSASRAG
jgi:DNA-binding PadR family transcriptional regulator